MNLIIASDLHLKPTAPIGRKDDYASTCLRKLTQLVTYANDSKSPLIIAGDFFDRFDVSTWFLNRVISICKQTQYGIYVIYGNHDQKNHSQDLNIDTSLHTLAQTGAVILPKAKHVIGFAPAMFHFCHFGQTPTEPSIGLCNILVMHVPVFETVKPFYMPDAYTASELEATYPGFDLYCVGDIHISCITDKVINPGSMMRASRAQKEHRPCFVEVDTDTNEKTIHYFEIEEDVWRTEYSSSKEEESFSAGLQELSEVLIARGEKLSYKDTATALLEGNEGLKERMLTIMEGYGHP